MASTTVTKRSPGAWLRIAFAMFAVGWGANQFSPMLIVYRHELRLTAGEVAGLFLVGGPASDRFGRRPVVWPFVALSPLATLLLMLGPRSLAVIAVGRALAGLCSGVVFGAATAWVQEVSPDDGLSARRSALALTAGFGLGPVVAAVLAQWAADPLVVPYLPHLVIGVAAGGDHGQRPRPEHQQQRGQRGQRDEGPDHRAATEPVRGRPADEQAGDQGQRVDQEQAGHLARGQPELVPVDDEHRRELVGAPADREHRERDPDPGARVPPGNRRTGHDIDPNPETVKSSFDCPFVRVGSWTRTLTWPR
jgi:hypothetical protein